MKASTSRVSCAALKSALVVALQLVEKGVDGLPIPGVKGCIGGILKIIDQEDLREANIATFKGLVSQITEFQSVTVARLSKEVNIPKELKSDIEGLARKLTDIPARYNETIGKRSTMRRIKSLISASAQAEALNNLGADLKVAIEQFQTALLVNMQLADMKRDADRLMDKLPVERKSFYNAHHERPTEVCEPDTRVSLLTTVAKWAEDAGPNHPRILWLNGRAGVGKSTVAKTLATKFDAGKMLGGSFMFSKPNGVTDGSTVFPTLAYQLARHFPEFRNYLVTAIEAKEDSIKAEIPKQFEDLLAVPLSRLRSPPVAVIILDALDECTPETLTPMLTSIVENIIRFPFLRIVITSRPENPVREVLQRFTGRIREVDISEISASDDIEKYLRARLSNAYSRLVRKAHQNETWPADKDLRFLVAIANNLFIFAATAVLFIGDKRAANPQRRLEIILRAQHIGQKHPFSSLDSMYREILRNALPEGDDDLHECFQTVVGAIIFSPKPHSVSTLAAFLGPKYSTSNIRNSLEFLHSVLIVPEEDDNAGLQVYHQSFAEFITDPQRCTLTEAYLCPSTHHARLCFRYLEILESVCHTSRSPDELWLKPVHLMTPGRGHWVANTTPDAVLDRVYSCSYHLGALRHQAIKDNKAAGVILQVQNRVKALLQPFRAYLRASESAIPLLPPPTTFASVIEAEFRSMRMRRLRLEFVNNLIEAEIQKWLEEEEEEEDFITGLPI